jgi:hypothetical protein
MKLDKGITPFIILINVVGALDKSNGITHHSYKPFLVLKEVL